MIKIELIQQLNYLLVDIALYLIQRYPNLATEKNEDGYCALEMMAQHPSAFPSGTKLTSWHCLIYSC